MDAFTLVFYGIICGGLAYMSPSLKNKILRLIAGVGIGLLAAAILPIIRSTLY